MMSPAPRVASLEALLQALRVGVVDQRVAGYCVHLPPQEMGLSTFLAPSRD